MDTSDRALYTPDVMTTAQGASTKELIVGVGVLVLIVALGFGAKAAFSPGEGADCKDSAWGCTFGTVCVEEDDAKVCRKSCEADRDCPKSQKCHALIVRGGKGPARACSP